MKEPESRTTRDERLRALLRATDAAAGAPDLTPVEVARLRRLALAAVPSQRLRRFAAPAWSLVVAAAALVALAVGLLMLRSVQPAPPERTAARPSAPARSTPARSARPPVATPPQVAAIASNEPSTVAQQPRTERRTPPVETAPRQRRGRIALPAREAPAPTTLAEPSAIAGGANDRQPVQLQLTAPGGTRIVWVLDPSTSNGR